MNVAERVLKPKKAGVFRTVFLYTGQGETSLLIIPTGPNVSDYMYVLVDSDLDKEPHEVNLVKLFKDLFRSSGKLSVFINTHPHNDHIGGILEIHKEIGFIEVWHANHKPGGKHKKKYEELAQVLKAVGKKNEFFLRGTNDLNKIRNSNDKEVIKKLGNIDFQVLSPAEYLCEDIEDGSANERDQRIHEQCGVIKFTYGKKPKSILFTGDSDKAAFKEHITEYHDVSLKADVLSASHHGSRSFFKNGEEDEDVYRDHMDVIKPTYIIISAPKQEDSPHDHPHDDAVDIYLEYVDEDALLHLGEGPYNVIVDIDDQGGLSITTDKELIEHYSDDEDGDGGDEEKGKFSKGAPFVVPSSTRIDHQPMGRV